MVAHRDTTIGAGVVVGAFTILGYADIGDNVLFGARVSLISGKYQHGRPEERAANETVSEVYERLTIGRNSWIGQEAILMANVGENCTVAAGSVVYKPVIDGTTVMGNPARRVSIDVASEKSERSSI
jgi:acetyltransferase-like isoleucine patch superfamily enzyme